MGIKYGPGLYYGTRGSIVETFFITQSKAAALSSVSLLPADIQANAKRFIGRASDAYNNFSISENTAGHYVMIKEIPGRVPGSRAVYFKIVNSSGKTIKMYKESYDPAGNLMHSKEKPVK